MRSPGNDLKNMSTQCAVVELCVREYHYIFEDGMLEKVQHKDAKPALAIQHAFIGLAKATSTSSLDKKGQHAI